MTQDDFRRSQDLFRSAGFTIRESGYDEEAFGSWWIELTKRGLPRQRVIWDGKDRWLIVAAFASSGTWMDKWVGRKKSGQTAEAALAQLELPVTHEWEQQIEGTRAEYWRQFQLEQALSSARGLWDAGCYSDYVREVSPFQDQLSPAEMKRLAIAQKRAAAS